MRTLIILIILCLFLHSKIKQPYIAQCIKTDGYGVVPTIRET